MAQMAWVPGKRPLDYTSNDVKRVMELFLHETGERYAEASLRHLPIPEWDANLVLINLDEQPSSNIRGVLYGTPFKDDIIRVAAFVISEEHQRKGLGGQAWRRLCVEAWKKGFRRVQLEVKADNLDAQRFYERRGLKIQQELVGYYQSGLGYMMQGPLSNPSAEKDYSPEATVELHD